MRVLLCFVFAVASAWGLVVQSSVRRLSTKQCAATIEKELTKLDVIRLAEQFVEEGNGFYSAPNADLYSEDFIFRGGVIGPLNKNDYLNTMEWLGVYKAFELKSNAFGFTQDPQNPLCVHYFTRSTGRHVAGFLSGGLLQPRPGFDEVNAPLEAAEVLFDQSGKVKFFTAGNVCASKTELQATNTNGLGAVFGLFCAIGQSSFATSALQSPVRTFNNVASEALGALGASNLLPKTRSSPADIPAWWTLD